ncbi:hypothetical protein [Bacteroides ndongoniae]|jgi:hypothetical protein|uniref:hypothetical protein n=1 Tax=Bacteroides ndongoniae TaxID=1903262 RepID=UPI0008D9A32F|nr:hypothetical protein [Bacteroides ndongoniae]
MGFFNFGSKGPSINHQIIQGKQCTVFQFSMKATDFVITCPVVSAPEPFISFPSYDPRLGRYVEIVYGEKDFVDDIQKLIDIIDYEDRGEEAFYYAFDVFVTEHINEFNRLIDTDLFRIISEIILMMEAILEARVKEQLPEQDKIDIVRSYINRTLTKFANNFYITKYRRTNFNIEPYLVKYSDTVR